MSWAEEGREEEAITITHGWDMNPETIHLCIIVIVIPLGMKTLPN